MEDSQFSQETQDKNKQQKIADLEQKLTDERKEWTIKIVDLAESQRSISKIAAVLVDCHSNRQILLEKIYDMNRIVFKLNSKITKTRADLLKKYTDTSSLSNNSYRYNDKDREKVIEAELIEPKNNLFLITNHIDFMKESIKTIDNMIWNIRYIISIHENNSPFK